MVSFVFDFSDEEVKADESAKEALKDPAKGIESEAIESVTRVATAENPILVLKDDTATLVHHTSGKFKKSEQGIVLEYGKSSDCLYAGIVSIDRRFIDLIAWLAETRADIRLSGKHTDKGYSVYKIHAVDATGRHRLKSQDEFLQTVILRLLASDIPTEEEPEDEKETETVNISDMTSISNFLRGASHTLPENIREWAYRNTGKWLQKGLQ